MLHLTALALFILPLPQDPPVPTPEDLQRRMREAATAQQQGFVDFSAELMKPDTTAGVGELGRMREGRRQRMREGGQLGRPGSVRQISGTQFFKVPVRARLEDFERLAGVVPERRVELSFDMQVARLPDGSEERQALTAGRDSLVAGMIGLWVVRKPKKGRGLGLERVLVYDPEAETAEKPLEAFRARMQDFCKINQCMADLRIALGETAAVAAAEEPTDVQRRSALQLLRAALDVEIELEDEARAPLIEQQVEPWRKRVRERIEALDGESPRYPVARVSPCVLPSPSLSPCRRQSSQGSSPVPS